MRNWTNSTGFMSVTGRRSVRLRSKRLAGGRESLYLDIYRGGTRSYEFLRLYLLPPKDRESRLRNRETMAEAEAIRALRHLALLREGDSEDPPRKFVAASITGASASSDNAGARLRFERGVERLLRLFAPEGLPDRIDGDWARRFVTWLRKDYRKSDGRSLEEGTVAFYVSRLSKTLNAAVREGRMAENPFSALPDDLRPRIPESRREFLSPEELARMAAAPCRYEMLKRAYMFSCHTSLRISDIRALRWRDLSSLSSASLSPLSPLSPRSPRSPLSPPGGRPLLSFVMKKTRRPQCIPLSRRAVGWLPDRGDASPDTLIFEGLPSLPTVEKALREWAAKAGVEKHVTYHTSRHTFGTMMMTAGADLYTTSRLMGHADPATTRIYARILDRRKIEAIEMLDRLYDGVIADIDAR